ncbi:MAG: magnesium transporter [Parcubacteria group bacterium]|nr:magnesium transporter [Parcubacteria group bacterium]
MMPPDANKLPELSALFPPQTAGSGMITDIPVFRREASVRDVRSIIFDHAREYDSVNYAYIVDEEWRLEGVVSIKELLQAKPTQRLASVMTKELVTANPMDRVPHVASLALQHNLKMVPIVDHKKRLVGAFSSNELLDILNKRFGDDLLRLSGVSVPTKHHTFDSWHIVWQRLPWMILGMVGGLVTGTVIGAFRSAIEMVVLLVVFIPVIMSTGATSANQSAMIFIRNLLHGDIKNRTQYLLNEIKVASLLGIIMAVLMFAVVALFLQQIVLAAAVSVSLLLTILAGSIIGVVTPMVLYRFKLDPAIGAGPFLTIIKDLVAMSIYFSVATALLSLWS